LVAGDRVRLARELRGLTQRELVDLAGGVVTSAALSQIEKGRTRPSAQTLAEIARATKCPPEFFVARVGDRSPAGFFRSLRAASARDRRQHLARARLLHDLVDALEEYVSLPELDLPRFALRRADEDDVEAVAERVRIAWQVTEGPVPHVTRLLERHGVVVVRVANFTREVDAFSVCFDQRPIVVLGSEKAATARSRFDAAHELAHLVLHSDEDAAQKYAERQAHAFAAAFLMPASVIREELPTRADWPKLIRLKARWRVSIQALLRRANTLGVMSDQRYVSALKAMSVRKWRVNEPGDDRLGPLEEPALLPSAFRHLSDLGLTWRDVARDASLPVDEVQRLIEGTRTLRPRVEL
jgi:Zn-dependent peptidase ImmA (M78 family)/DNA-binding XRE family transcriptional regulator